MTDVHHLSPSLIIDAFLGSYKQGDGSVLSDVNRGMVRAVLEDFLLDEWWLQTNAGYEALIADIAALGELTAGQDRSGDIVCRLKASIGAWAARLERSERALLIQRHHAMMLSESLKQERLKTRC